MAKAVVFGYHDVGVRCLGALLEAGVGVPLVVTHRDDASERIFFASVAALARRKGIPTVLDPEREELLERVRAAAPDFIFSFYYRRMLPPEVLATAKRGAYNMHGSLLPKYRGRAPVNWAVLHGERRTGATLHYMADKPDAGDIVAQQTVPILPDDTAREVFEKVTVAAEICLDATLPALIAGTAPRLPNDIKRGSYFGGRTPDDGRIDWRQSALAIHNLVRAVAPPYPGARATIAGVSARVLKTRVLDAGASTAKPALLLGERIVAHCGGGGTLAIDALELDGRVVTAAEARQRFAGACVPLA